MPDTQPPTATVAGQSIALHVTGYPDIPNRWGAGRIRVTGIRLDYGNGHTPDGRHAFITGLWVNDDGEVTDQLIDQDYDAHDGDTSGWPDEIADLAKKHTPADRADVLLEAAEAVAALDRRKLGIASDTIRDAWEEGRDEGADELRRLADEAQQPGTTPRCSCGGQFPLHHLNADTHDPITPAQEA